MNFLAVCYGALRRSPHRNQAGGRFCLPDLIIRQFLPPREAGARIGLVLMATVLGMAAGGLASGFIYDATGSYRAAFLQGFLWNLVNLAIVCWLLLRPHAGVRAATG